MKTFFALQLIVTFEKHINELCKKRNLKLYALTRCAEFMSTEKTLNIESIYNLAIQLLPVGEDVP